MIGTLDDKIKLIINAGMENISNTFNILSKKGANFFVSKNSTVNKFKKKMVVSPLR